MQRATPTVYSHYTKLLTLLSPIFQVVAVLDVVADVVVTAVVVVDVAVVARRTRRLGRDFYHWQYPRQH